jgi:histidyl-tRNA synthetase
MSKPIQAVRGMNDVLPEESPRWQFFHDTARGWLQLYGYREIKLPLLEKSELFSRSIGQATDIVSKEMYTFEDTLSGESLTLRPEGTASCVRAVIEHNLLYSQPHRLYYEGPMFRHERPQKGRYRQFHQIGVEAFGFVGPDIDAEHMVMCARLWKELGLSGLKLELNSLGDAESRARHRGKLVEHLRKNYDALDDDSKRRLELNPLRVLDSKNPALSPIIASAPRLIDELDPESREHFEHVQTLLTDRGVDFEIVPRLVRGLDYYNRTVYEWVSDALGAQATVCAGGRYDRLVAELGGKPAPACGFALGVERVLTLMKDAEAKPAGVYLAHHGENTDRYAFKIAEMLRDAKIAVVFDASGGSFKSQMKRADASSARFALLIGEDETRGGVVSLKPLREAGEQIAAPIEDIIARIKMEEES